MLKRGGVTFETGISLFFLFRASKEPGLRRGFASSLPLSKSISGIEPHFDARQHGHEVVPNILVGWYRRHDIKLLDQPRNDPVQNQFRQMLPRARPRSPAPDEVAPLHGLCVFSQPPAGIVLSSIPPEYPPV